MEAATSAGSVRRGRSWPIVMLVVLLIAALVTAAALLFDRWRGISLPVMPLTTSSHEIAVSSSDSIAAAILRAAPGSTIIVEPGEYREQVRLKSGVRVKSRVPRAASIRLRGDAAETDPAVLGVDVAGAELSGFRIIGDAATPLGSGIYLRNADVSLSDLEVTGAVVAAIEIAAGGSSLSAVHVHDNPGAGLVVRSQASPRIVHSQFAHNGGADRTTAAIVIEPGARPDLTGNVFHGISPDVLTGLSRGNREAVRQSNWFIRSDGRGGGARSTPPARRPPQGRP